MNLLVMAAVSAVSPSQWTHYAHFGSVADIVSSGGSVVCATTGGVAFGTIGEAGLTAWDSVWTYPGELSHSNCRCLAAEPDGSIWVGTWGGGIDLFRPGSGFTHFGQLEGLPISQQINAILPDTSVFAATTQGLAIMEYAYFQTWTGLSTGGGLTSDIVKCLAPSDSGLFVGTEAGISHLGAGLYPGSPSSWTRYPEMDGKKLREFAWCSDTLWAAADDGLYFLPSGSGTWERDASFPFDEALCLASDGTDLAAGSGWLANVREGGVWTSRTVKGGQDVKAIAFGPGGLVCAGVSNELDADDSGAGIGVRWNDFYVLSAPSGIPSCTIHSVTLADDGTCWVTTENMGAGVLMDGSWVSYLSVLPGEHQVFTSESQPGGSVFISPYAYGVAWLDNSGTRDTSDDTVIDLNIGNSGLLSDRIRAIDRAPTGETWFGQTQVAPGEAAGVTRLDWTPGETSSASWVSWTASDGLPAGAVQAVYGLPGGSAWVGTATGLALVGPAVGQVSAVMDASDGLPDDEVTALALARTGRLFVGTAFGLGVVEPGALTAGEVEGVDGAVTALVEDNTGSVWAATDEALYRILPGGGLEEYNTLNCPLLSTVMHDLACDRDAGLLYIGTDHGMWRVDLGEGLGGDGGGAVIYPNPFMPGEGEVLGVAGLPDAPTTIRVFDLTGALVYEFASPDRDGIAWDGTDSGGEPASSGVYLVQVVQDGCDALTGLALVR